MEVSLNSAEGMRSGFGTDGLLKMVSLLNEFSANIDVCRVCVHDATSNKTAFDKLVGITTKNIAIFARSRFTLVRIYYKVTVTRPAGK